MLSLLPRPPRLCGPTWMSRGLRLKWEAASLCALEQAAERSHHPVLILPWGRASPRRRTCGERGAPRPEDVAKSGAAPRGKRGRNGLARCPCLVLEPLAARAQGPGLRGA